MNMACAVKQTEVILSVWRGNTKVFHGRYRKPDGTYQILTGMRIVFSAQWRDGGLLRLSTDNGSVELEDETTWTVRLEPWQTRLFPNGQSSVRFEVEMQFNDDVNQWRELSRWRGWFNVDGGVNDEGMEPDAGAYTNTFWQFPIYFFAFGEGINLTGLTFVGTLYDANLAPVMQFGGAGPGTINMTQAAQGKIAMEATPAQHAAVPAGSYTWQLNKTVPTPIEFWASGTLTVSQPGGAKTDFKVKTWQDGAGAAVWVPSFPPEGILIEDPI